jgi:hypothetical protein
MVNGKVLKRVLGSFFHSAINPLFTVCVPSVSWKRYGATIQACIRARPDIGFQPAILMRPVHKLPPEYQEQWLMPSKKGS